jgi:hypothetical protein
VKQWEGQHDLAISTRQAARILRSSYRMPQDWCDNGTVHSWRAGKARRMMLSDLLTVAMRRGVPIDPKVVTEIVRRCHEHDQASD